VYRWELDKDDQSFTVAVNGPLIVDDVELMVRAGRQRGPRSRPEGAGEVAGFLGREAPLPAANPRGPTKSEILLALVSPPW
jgi:hypothetical protein